MILGGSGFLGSALRSALSRRGRKAVIAGRAPDMAVDEGERYVPVDALDRIEPGEIGATVDLSQAWGGAPEYDRVLARRHLDLTQRLGCDRHLFVSSGGTVYGEAAELPIAEDSPLEPRSDYGLGKRMAEEEVLSRWRDAALPAIIVRPGNVYGPGHRRDTGQGLVTALFTCAARGSTLTVFGDGSQVRDYIYIMDTGEGLLAALDSGTPGTAYNLGTGTGTSVRRLIELATEIAGPIEVDWQPARDQDVSANILDCRRLHSDTGWSSEVRIEEGLRRTWAALRGRDL